MVRNVQETAKVVLRGEYMAIKSYLKKQEKSQINNLTYTERNYRKKKQNPKLVGGKKS